MDRSRLHIENTLLKEQNKRLLEANRHLLDEIERLKFGQPGVLVQTPEAPPAAPPTPASHRPRSERRRTGVSRPPTEPRVRQTFGHTEQTALDVVDTVATLDEPDFTCPQCGETLHEMKGQFEQTEIIDHIPERFIRRRILRQKYVCRCGSCVETACHPVELATEGSRYSLDFALRVAVDKYLDHTPLERQVRQMGRAGLIVTSTVLFDLLVYLARLAQPTYEALPAHICARTDVVGMDESTWPLLDKGRKSWKIISLNCAEAVHYRIDAHANGLIVGELLKGFQGIVQTDGSSIYRTAQTQLTPALQPPPFELAGCWAHCRRKFIEAQTDFPQATQALDLIGELYGIEKKARDGAHRLELRQTESAAVLERLEQWRKTTEARAGTTLATALGYLSNQWTSLTVFLRHPGVGLDNNASERSLRGPILGRKNHYGSKTERGTQIAALFYSLCENAKLSNVDPVRYLRAIVRAARAKPGAVVLPWDLPSEPDG